MFPTTHFLKLPNNQQVVVGGHQILLFYHSQHPDLGVGFSDQNGQATKSPNF